MGIEHVHPSIFHTPKPGFPNLSSEFWKHVFPWLLDISTCMLHGQLIWTCAELNSSILTHNNYNLPFYTIMPLTTWSTYVLILYFSVSLNFHTQSYEFSPNYFSNISFPLHCHFQSLCSGPHDFLTREFLFCFTNLSLEHSDPSFIMLLKLFLQNTNLIILFHSWESYTIYTIKAKLFQKASFMIWQLLLLWLYHWPRLTIYSVSHPCHGEMARTPRRS